MHAHIGTNMRIEIDVDDQLMADAMKTWGEKSKKATVEKGLKLLTQIGRQSRTSQSSRQTPLGRLAGRDAIGQVTIADASVWKNVFENFPVVLDLPAGLVRRTSRNWTCIP